MIYWHLPCRCTVGLNGFLRLSGSVRFAEGMGLWRLYPDTGHRCQEPTQSLEMKHTTFRAARERTAPWRRGGVRFNNTELVLCLRPLLPEITTWAEFGFGGATLLFFGTLLCALIRSFSAVLPRPPSFPHPSPFSSLLLLSRRQSFSCTLPSEKHRLHRCT